MLWYVYKTYFRPNIYNVIDDIFEKETFTRCEANTNQTTLLFSNKYRIVQHTRNATYWYYSIWKNDIYLSSHNIYLDTMLGKYISKKIAGLS